MEKAKKAVTPKKADRSKQQDIKTPAQKQSPEKLEKVVVICGPTATGKSDLAVLIAKKFGGEIISADSRQVYKGLDLGSGKITKKEMRGIPHFMLDIVEPKRTYTVDKFSKEALNISKEILKKNKFPIICGGTGMYIDALIDGIEYPQVLPDKKLRKELSTFTTENLFKKLMSLDNNRAEQLKNDNSGEFNRVRLIRSIEIATKIGVVPPLIKKTRFDAMFIGLDFDDKTIKDRILLRIKSRMKKGMLAEARNLYKNGLRLKRMHELGLEYGHLASVLEGKISKEEFEQVLANDIWHFVKRQRTWFKRRSEILWFKPSKTNFKKIESVVKKFLNTNIQNVKNEKNRSAIN
ncbi:MAG: tRNA (adenosine(37)-N6)-dimethylallyltransferase MiaA [bacterium]